MIGSELLQNNWKQSLEMKDWKIIGNQSLETRIGNEPPQNH